VALEDQIKTKHNDSSALDNIIKTQEKKFAVLQETIKPQKKAEHERFVELDDIIQNQQKSEHSKLPALANTIATHLARLELADSRIQERLRYLLRSDAGYKSVREWYLSTFKRDYVRTAMKTNKKSLNRIIQQLIGGMASLIPPYTLTHMEEQMLKSFKIIWGSAWCDVLPRWE